jgi:DNA ligase-1
MRRFGRRQDVEAQRRELPLSVCFFDCLHLDGEDWLDRSGAERFAALCERVPEPLRVARTVTEQSAEAQAFFDAALAAGHEGVSRSRSPLPTKPDAAAPAGSR